HRRGHNISAALLFPPARPRQPKPFLSRVSARSRAPARPAMVRGRRPLRRRIGNIWHASLRAARRDFALRHSATQTLAGPSAVYLDLEVEKWLKARTAAREVTHVLHVPSNPPGWTAGKWGEWYPDVLGPDGKLTTAKAKPYWQPGWL